MSMVELDRDIFELQPVGDKGVCITGPSSADDTILFIFASGELC